METKCTLLSYQSTLVTFFSFFLRKALSYVTVTTFSLSVHCSGCLIIINVWSIFLAYLQDPIALTFFRGILGLHCFSYVIMQHRAFFLHSFSNMQVKKGLHCQSLICSSCLLRRTFSCIQYYLMIGLNYIHRYNFKEILVNCCHDFYWHSIGSVVWAYFDHEFYPGNLDSVYIDAPGNTRFLFFFLLIIRF